MRSSFLYAISMALGFWLKGGEQPLGLYAYRVKGGGGGIGFRSLPRGGSGVEVA